jgi:hypothetical protein
VFAVPHACGLVARFPSVNAFLNLFSNFFYSALMRPFRCWAGLDWKTGQLVIKDLGQKPRLWQRVKQSMSEQKE